MMNAAVLGIGTATGGGFAAVGPLAAEVSEVTAIGFYLLYTVVAIGLVMFLARTLYRNGQIFLEEAFDEPKLANAVNQLLVIGFYLLNLGYALVVYRLQESYESLTFAFNELVARIGILLLSLGAIHLLNMFVFWRIRTGRDRSQRSRQLPPPAAFVPPPPMAAAAQNPAAGVGGGYRQYGVPQGDDR